jgi:hypothetical protein
VTVWAFFFIVMRRQLAITTENRSGEWGSSEVNQIAGKT